MGFRVTENEWIQLEKGEKEAVEWIYSLLILWPMHIAICALYACRYVVMLMNIHINKLLIKYDKFNYSVSNLFCLWCLLFVFLFCLYGYCASSVCIIMIILRWSLVCVCVVWLQRVYTIDANYDSVIEFHYPTSSSSPPDCCCLFVVFQSFYLFFLPIETSKKRG